MVQSLDLSGHQQPKIRRLNRLPIVIGLGLVVVFLGVVFWGLSSRGFYGRGPTGPEIGGRGGSASSFADQMKRGVADGIIGEPADAQPFQPVPVAKPAPDKPTNPFVVKPLVEAPERPPAEPDNAWRARLEREGQEQLFREAQRERMARVQAASIAHDSPLALDLKKLQGTASGQGARPTEVSTAKAGSAADLYTAALKAGITGQTTDPNGQKAKEEFFNQDLKSLGYLASRVVGQTSPFELKRGSVIPATLVSGINSDLPGRIIAQVGQNVFDSVTGSRLLIPQGAKLLGRYDSKVSFGQNRVLVVWTDIVFPNGSTLQIGGMAGTDAEGYGGFSDQVDNHYLRTFGSAILLAVIGAGMDMAIPQNSTLSNQETASDAARRNFAETFGRVAERTITKNLDVQPTIEIRPGYRFNVLVDQDVVFPGSYRG
jgi:type IV secretion system protein VirB10